MDRVTYIKLKQSMISLIVRIVGLTLFLFLFWWAKSWFFGWLGDLTGWQFLYTVASMSFLFWISIIVYGFMVLGVLVKWFSITYEIFTDRIAISTGLVSKHKRVVSISDFSQFEVQQGMLGRLFRYGTIEFMYRTIGPTGGYGEVFYNINNPAKVGADLRSLMKMADETGEASGVKQPSVDEKHKQDAETMVVAAQAAEQDQTKLVDDNVVASEEVVGEVEDERGEEVDQGDEVAAADISGEIDFG